MTSIGSSFSDYREPDLIDKETTTTEEEPSYHTGQNTSISQTEMTNTKTKGFSIKKPSDFEGDRKKMQSFVLQCKAYLKVN
jgi:hypothetical protein